MHNLINCHKHCHSCKEVISWTHGNLTGTKLARVFLAQKNCQAPIKSWHNNWIKIWLTATCMEVTGVFPVSRRPHFLSEWQGGSGVKEKGQQSVLHQPPALPPCLQSLSSAFSHSMWCYFLKWPDELYSIPPSFPLSVVHAPSFMSLLFLPPSCWHTLSVPPGDHTGKDLTVSAIQSPKSNYHGHNSVIKSNGWLDEAPTLKQNKSFSTLLHIILCYFVWYDEPCRHFCTGLI